MANSLLQKFIFVHFFLIHLLLFRFRKKRSKNLWGNLLIRNHDNRIYMIVYSLYSILGGNLFFSDHSLSTGCLGAGIWIFGLIKNGSFLQFKICGKITASRKLCLYKKKQKNKTVYLWLLLNNNHQQLLWTLSMSLMLLMSLASMDIWYGSGVEVLCVAIWTVPTNHWYY